MAKQTINIGTTANDGTGDAIRAAFGKVNDNFTEIYTANTGVNTGDQNLSAYATTAAVAAGYQPLDSDLTAISALTTTAYGRALLSTADAATLRSAIGVGTTDAPTFLAQTLTNNASIASGKIIIGLDGTNDYTIQAFQGATRVGRIGFNEIGNNIVIAPFANTRTLFTGGISIGAASPNNDCFLERDAPGILAQRNGVNAQAFRVYNTYTDASNYERGYIQWSSGNLLFGYEAGGTGSTSRTVVLRGSSIGGVRIDNGANLGFEVRGGNFLALIDNAYDIGASGARPKDIYVAGNATIGAVSILGGFGGIIRAGDSGFFTFGSSRSTINSPADSIMRLANAAGNDFNRLQLGGTTSAFPAIKRNGTGIDIRLADDSGLAPLSASNIVTSGYFSTSGYCIVGSNNGYFWPFKGGIYAPSDGVMRLSNDSVNGFTRLELGTANLGISRGAGSPEGVVTALVGSLYIRTDGGASTTLYVKESSPTPSTGWVAK